MAYATSLDRKVQALVSEKSGSVLPVYVRLPRSGHRCHLTGLSRFSLNLLVLPCSANSYRAPVKSIVVKQPGAVRGPRLILVESLLAHLASLASDDSVISNETASAAAKGGRDVL